MKKQYLFSALALSAFFASCNNEIETVAENVKPEAEMQEVHEQLKELNNKALHILGLYFLNVLYIPCFLLKYVHKDEKTTIKNIIYIIVIILLMVCFTVLSGKFSLSQVNV